MGPNLLLTTVSVQSPLKALLDETETMLWSGCPDAACYLQNKKMSEKVALRWFCAILLAMTLFNVIVDHKMLSVPSVMMTSAISIFAAVAQWTSQNFKVPDWHYAVTNKRVLYQYHGEDGLVTRQLLLTEIKTIYLKQSQESVGSLRFVPTFLAPNTGIKFECINGAGHVQEIVNELKSKGN